MSLGAMVRLHGYRVRTFLKQCFHKEWPKTDMIRKGIERIEECLIISSRDRELKQTDLRASKGQGMN